MKQERIRSYWILSVALLLFALGGLAYWRLYPTSQQTASVLGQVLLLPEQQEKPLLDYEQLHLASMGTQPLLTADGQPIPALVPGLDWSAENAQPSERMQKRREARKLVKGGRIEREEQYLFMLMYPGTSFPLGSRQKGYELLQEQTAALSSQDAEAGSWQPVGPAPIKGGNLGDFPIDSVGRTTALLIHPQNPDIVYAGGAQGGVWKTINAGQSWTPLTDGQASLATGSMTFDPNNPNILYVGTGEPHQSTDAFYGAGILKSSDAGVTWAQLGADKFAGMGIADIVIPPNNANTIWAAASAQVGGTKPLVANPGVYRSTNGGAAWTAVLTVCDSQGNCTSPSSLLMHPANTNILFAAFDEYGIVRTTNGGANWTRVLSLQQGINRAEVAISRSNPQVLYAGLEALLQSGGTLGAVFRSTNGGDTWGHLNALQVSYCGDQCSYDNILAVKPNNPDFLLAGGQALYSNGVPGIDGVIFRTTDGGASWTTNAGTSSITTLHPDLHAIAFASSNPNIVWQGNDGGVFRSTDSGNTWQPRQGNMATLQFQSVALHPTDPNVLFGGMQDNAKAKSLDGGATWVGVDVGDGGFTAIDPFDSKYWYGTRFSLSGQFMQFQRNDANGSLSADDWPIRSSGIGLNDRVLFYAPLLLDPNTAGVAYWGTHMLYRSSNRGNSWTAISGDLTKNAGRRSALSTIAVKKGLGNVILVGTADGNVQLTTNDGASWTNVTKSPLPNRYVTEVAIQDANVMFVSYSGFAQNTPGASGHVYRTTNGGQTWTDISRTGQVNGLPDLPVSAMVLDPTAPGTIYAGTDLGVYRTTDGGTSWVPFNTGLPRVAVFDLALQSYPNGKRYLVAATHGRSQFRYDLGADSQPTPTPTPTRTPDASLNKKLYLPMTGRTFGTAPQPTATPTKSPTKTPTPTVPGNVPSIRNGNFEQGRNGDWSESSSNGFDIVTDADFQITPHSGSWLAWLGGIDEEVSTLSQSVTLPAGPAVSLSFWFYIGSLEDDCNADIAAVKINNVTVWATGLCSLSNSGGWQNKTINLGAYAGQTIAILFRVETDFALNSNFFVDDVILQAAAGTQAEVGTPEPEITPGMALTPVPAKESQVQSSGTAALNIVAEAALYAGPDASYRTRGRIAAGQVLAVPGVSADGRWWRVTCPDKPTGACWLAADPAVALPVENGQ